MNIRGTSKNRRREKAFELQRMVGLGDRVKHKPSELSVGQQQRAAIAGALANESTGAVDTKTREMIVELLKRLSKKDKTIIVATHDMEVARHG